jgi:single-strand DNA-binding protein
MAEVKLAALNKVMLMGRLTRDPEVRVIPSGVSVANLGLAINRRYKDKTGEWKDDTCFVTVVLWSKQAEVAQRYLRKGSAIYVEGRLESRSWEGKDGEKRSTLEVRADRFEFLDKTTRREDGMGGEPVGAASENYDASGPSDGDDIPF